MTLLDVIEVWNSNAGGIMVFVIIVCSLVQVSKIQINPLSWFGNAINKGTNAKIDELRQAHTQTRDELREHIAQSYRNKIFDFQDELIRGLRHTHEQWREVLDACATYEEYVEKNKLNNGKSVEAIKYIRNVYQKCLASGEFVFLQKGEQNENVG